MKTFASTAYSACRSRNDNVTYIFLCIFWKLCGYTHWIGIYFRLNINLTENWKFSWCQFCRHWWHHLSTFVRYRHTTSFLLSVATVVLPHTQYGKKNTVATVIKKGIYRYRATLHRKLSLWRLSGFCGLVPLLTYIFFGGGPTEEEESQNEGVGNVVIGGLAVVR